MGSVFDIKIDNLNCRIVGLKERIDKAEEAGGKDLDAMAKRITKLEEADEGWLHLCFENLTKRIVALEGSEQTPLAKYGMHLAGCRFRHGGAACSCGLAEALKDRG